MLYFTLFCTLSVVFGGYNPFFVQNWSPACCEEANTNYNCEYTYDRCQWWGDPHTTTFDGTKHHHQGAANGRYRYVSPCNSDFVTVPFQIIGKHKPCGSNPSLRCNDFVDIRLYSTSGAYWRTIRVDDNYNVEERNENGGGVIVRPSGTYPLPSTVRLNSKYTVTTFSTYVEIKFFSNLLCDGLADFVVRLDNSATRVEVDLNPYYKRYVCGLCGYYNDLQCDDFAVAFEIYNYDICYQFDISQLPSSMWSYSPSNWNTINWFGWFWRDWGWNKIRRLVDEDRQVADDNKFDRNKIPKDTSAPEGNTLKNQDTTVAQEVCEQNERGGDDECADELVGQCGEKPDQECFNKHVKDLGRGIKEVARDAAKEKTFAT